MHGSSVCKELLHHQIELSTSFLLQGYELVANYFSSTAPTDPKFALNPFSTAPTGSRDRTSFSNLSKLSFAVGFATCLSTDLQLNRLQSCAFIIAFCHTCGLNTQGIPYVRMYLNGQFAFSSRALGRRGWWAVYWGTTRDRLGPPNQGENANREQNWVEVVESGKNATREIGMLTHLLLDRILTTSVTSAISPVL